VPVRGQLRVARIRPGSASSRAGSSASRTPPVWRCRTWAGTGCGCGGTASCWRGFRTDASTSCTPTGRARGRRRWLLAESDYGAPFVAAVQRGQVIAVQFHPEKSGEPGIELLRRFLGRGACKCRRPDAAHGRRCRRPGSPSVSSPASTCAATMPAIWWSPRAISTTCARPARCATSASRWSWPALLQEGADEITFLNITAFRDFPLRDQPMLEVLRRTSEQVFVPLTIGGGIRAFTDADGQGLQRAGRRRRVFPLRRRQDLHRLGRGLHGRAGPRRGGADGGSAIEQIAERYGNQAVVISIDPRRVYVARRTRPSALVSRPTSRAERRALVLVPVHRQAAGARAATSTRWSWRASASSSAPARSCSTASTATAPAPASTWS
jgi:hypothetical protein